MYKIQGIKVFKEAFSKDSKEEEEVQLKTNFREDLEADSLDLFQIINDIEDEFDIKIESEEGLNTVQDIVTFVEAELAKK